MSQQNSAKPLPPIRDRALACLARRDHTRLELTRKLRQAGYADDAITGLLDDFAQRGWLSDARFAEHYVQHKQARFGNLKLAGELRSRGVEEAIVQTLLTASKASELERAKEIWRKKFGAPPADAREKSRQIRFLQNRGFAFELVCRVVGGKPHDED